ncbi:MAG: YifB family Mg chelatase-like AAA ATPase [Candidatus Paceibacterota bacterium]
MAVARTHSAQVRLLGAEQVLVEVDLSGGLHAFSLVGLPDKAVEEAKDRVSAALKNSGYTSPKQTNQKVVVSLAPAHSKKEGAVFDCAIALAYLVAAGEITAAVDDALIAGELSLDGSTRSIAGALSLAKHARDNGFAKLYVPRENAAEAALIDGIKVYGVTNLTELIELATGVKTQPSEPAPDTSTGEAPLISIDMAEVHGQESAKRGLEIAAAGGHNVAMSGPPGTGKTMLAQAFNSLLPPPNFEEALEITAIHSVAGELPRGPADGPIMRERPFRSPHHTSSYTALIGGGTIPKPGEITLAHHGILFLDEFPEFDRRVIESLRQPLENRSITVARTAGHATFPANFLLVAAMNPCPCGNYGAEDRSASGNGQGGKICRCSPHQLSRYQQRLSGPIIDRIDVWLTVADVDHSKLSDYSNSSESTSIIQKRVAGARKKAHERARNAGSSARINKDLSSREIIETGLFTPDAQRTLTETSKHYDLSARSYYKVARVARTIADLEESEKVLPEHVFEAITYRPQANN